MHPKALDYLAEEFVASDYDLRTLVKLVVTSDAYQRAHAPSDSRRTDARWRWKTSLLATPMRRMIAESLYDSVVTAGHLFEVKHSPGKNEKTIVRDGSRAKSGKPGEIAKAGWRHRSVAGNEPAMKAMAGDARRR